ncbi:hypothetical protein J5N97_001242 [Dioscorea zingiberensis]|uniref:AtC3H46-like PABC-like domain-containing protein n=1 Tax=Dioscorea zingiberensis TaxID=325984 RepID=A0A9D5BU80_9LILI|nr:hypothetical protein J5N97_001242 [Dioscorea zingiberensis]
MLLLQSSGDEELYQYAYGPENILHSKISDIKVAMEDAPKYNDHGNEIIDSGSIGGSSHLIHPTFLADSLFTAKDVPKHFSSKYGPVHNTRIHPAKWMFNCVSLDSAEIVNSILSSRKTQVICGNVVHVEGKPKVSERILKEQEQEKKVESKQSPHATLKLPE